MSTTIKQQWDSYFDQVMPPAANPVQCQETRRAFYAGAWAMFCSIAAGEAAELPTEQFIEFMSRLEEECKDFNKTVSDGKA